MRFILPRVLTSVMSFGTNMLTIFTASLTEPPPLPRKSNTRPFIPLCFRSMNARRTSLEHPSVKLFRLIYPMLSGRSP